MIEKEEKKLLQCWKHFACDKTECPGYGSNEYCCWLLDGNLCHTELDDNWINRFDVCINCEILINNIRYENWSKTLELISEHFKNYQESIKEKQKKLQEFKITSSYLLKELEKKSLEVLAERENLEKKVKERTKDLHRMQTKLMQTSKMAAIGRFSAGIAHEINNPLGAIINLPRILLENPEIKKMEYENLELISKGLFRIESIVKQILGYSAFNESDIQPVNLNYILNETLGFIRNRFQEKRIEIIMKPDKALPQIQLNPAQIQQVFLNILMNAFDSLGEKGKLLITSKFDNNKISVGFKDNGKGIKKEILDKIFEPFFTTKDVGEGTGLGLFICYNIIRLYNGSIYIKSIENKETEVIISLPVMEE